MNSLIQLPNEPIPINIPCGTTTGFTNSKLPWHALGASNQIKGDAGVAVVIACMKAAGTTCKKINGQGDIDLTIGTAEVKYARETIVLRSDGGVSRNWRCNGIRPNETQWRWIYLVVEQGDHADNSWLVLEFDREAMLRILDEGLISMYGQPGADDGDSDNVMELRANQNSARDEINDYLIPRALNVVEIPQSLLQIDLVEQ